MVSTITSVFYVMKILQEGRTPWFDGHASEMCILMVGARLQSPWREKKPVFDLSRQKPCNIESLVCDGVGL